MVELRKIILGRVRRNWQLVLLGGLAIYAASLLAPGIMFSGQHNFHLLAGLWQQKDVGFLLLRSVLKLGLLTICLNTGWLGGDIFPVLFAATAQGIALSHLVPQLDPVFVIGVFAISMGATILESPVVAGSLMIIMFLPVNLAGVGIAATLLLMIVDQFQGRVVRRYGSQFTALDLSSLG
jgi:H+/Cl- antiporter ClcA